MPARRILITSLALLILASHNLAAQRGARLVPYHKLAWQDFPVRDGGDPSEQAHTQGRITYRYNAQVTGRNGSYNAVITSLAIDSGFDALGSWRRSEIASDPDVLLQHEQGHQREIAQSRPLRAAPARGGRRGSGRG